MDNWLTKLAKRFSDGSDVSYYTDKRRKGKVVFKPMRARGKIRRWDPKKRRYVIDTKDGPEEVHPKNIVRQ